MLLPFQGESPLCISITQGAASLCPGLRVGCPFRAYTAICYIEGVPILLYPLPSSFILSHPPSSSPILLHPLSSSPILSHPLSSSPILSHPPKVKKCGLENKCILTFELSASAKKLSTLRRKNPQTPRKIFLSNVKKFISEVKTPFFSPQKEEKTRLFRALSSSLVQR